MINENEELSRLVDVIVRKVFPQKIFLFGSRAAGAADAKSDYDIFILVKKCTGTRKVEKELYYLIAQAGIRIPVDLIVETEEKFERLKNNRYLVYNQVSEYGKTIYEAGSPVPAVA